MLIQIDERPQSLKLMLNFRNYNSIFALIIVLLLSGCGKSPFLKMSDAAAGPMMGSREVLSKRTFLNFNNSHLKVEVIWPSRPITDELISAYLLFFDDQNQMIDPPDFEFEPTMPDMGHGTSPVIISKLSTGIYKVEEIFFSMPGKWVVEIFLKASGKKESVKFEVNL